MFIGAFSCSISALYDAIAKMARKIEACLEEEPAECFLLPPVGNDDRIFGLVGSSAFDEAGDGHEFAAPLLDGFCDNRYLFIGIYVAETPGIIGGGAER